MSSLNQLTSSLADITTGTKTAQAGFTDLGKAVIRSLEEMLIKMIIVLPIARSLQAALGGGVNLGGASAGNGAPGTVPGFHGGGTTNEPSFTRYVHPAYFDHAPRFHSGIGPDEMPAIIRRDEGVFTAGQMRAMGAAAGGGNHVQVNVINNAAGTSVKTNKRKSGGASITDIIVSTVGHEMATGGFDGPMRARFGHVPQPRDR